MKLFKNNRWLLVLMIISQVMLTGLLIQWLRSQWADEKELLQGELDRQFRESVDQVIDSMLVKHIIVPVLDDSSGAGDHLIRFRKNIAGGSQTEGRHVTAIVKDTGSSDKAFITVAVPGPGPGPANKSNGDQLYLNLYDSAEKNILLRSVKLIINTTGDSTGKSRPFRHIINQVPDTVLLKELFENRVANSGTKLTIHWNSDTSAASPGSEKQIMIFRGNFFERPFNAEIMNFGKIIFKGVLPQMLFAFVLLIVTAAAFFFTWRSLKRMEVMNNLRNDFVNNISHELKTPVSTVTIALEALQTYDRLKDPVKAEEYLSIALKEIRRLALLISQVLDVSLFGEQKDFLNPEPADLDEIIAETLVTIRGRLEQCGAEVIFENSGGPSIINLDRLHVQGVILNLLDNSLKYAQVHPVIRITTAKTAGFIVVSIKDNGPGIPQEYIGRIFERFFRIPAGNRHNVKGYGLGLSYAELVMKQHSGSISVRNNSEGGCEFILSFPKSLK